MKLILVAVCLAMAAYPASSQNISTTGLPTEPTWSTQSTTSSSTSTWSSAGTNATTAPSTPTATNATTVTTGSTTGQSTTPSTATNATTVTTESTTGQSTTPPTATNATTVSTGSTTGQSTTPTSTNATTLPTESSTNLSTEPTTGVTTTVTQTTTSLPPTEGPTTTLPPTEGPTTTVSSTSTLPSSTTEFVAQCTVDSPETFPHPTDCSLFYTCSNGNLYLQGCPPGLVFNPETNICDWPANVNCENAAVREILSDQPTTCPAVDIDGEYVRIPHETNCNYYYLCNNGSKLLYRCTETLHLNPLTRVCAPADEAGCDSCPVKDVPSQTVRLPHETNCNYYYLCNSGNATLYMCSGGFHLSPIQRICTTPFAAQCNQSTHLWDY